MPVTVETVVTLQRYFRHVVERAEHHGKQVNEVIYPLIGCVLLVMDTDKPLEVWGNDVSSALVLWFYAHGQRYAFRYEHSDGTIEQRAGTHTGRVVGKWSNGTSIAQLKADFAAL